MISPASSSNVVSTLLDALVEEAPVLVRTRQLLPALDWRHARPDQISALIARLLADGMKVPPWLAEDILAAGHVVPEDALPPGAPWMQLLSVLNSTSASSEATTSLAHEIAGAGFAEQLPPVAAKRLVARLVELGETSAAAKIALTVYPSAPDGMRLAKTHVANYLATLPQIRVRVGGTSSTQELARALAFSLGAAGFRAEIGEAAYGAIMPELLQPEVTDALILLLDDFHFMPQDWRKTPQQLRMEFDDRVAALTESIVAYCESTGTPLIVTTLPAAAYPAAGHADWIFDAGSAHLRSRFNAALGKLTEQTPLLYLLDADQALSALPSEVRYDAKAWFYGRFAYSERACRLLAAAAARLWRARSKGTAKVLALDFDNTLWGGVYGDDGIAKLQCGDDFPGSAYKAFQQECLRLKSLGMILIGLSKNNQDALHVFENHPGVVLRREDFVATAVNWEPKAENLRKLAAELKLGLDAVVFLDDSLHERAAMRRMCPEVLVPDMPCDAAARPLWIRSLPYTWPVRITGEDAKRSNYYAAAERSRELRASSADYGDYLARLKQHLEMQFLTPSTLPRVAQLHQRTNQFNLTNERYGEAELAQYCEHNPAHLAFTGSVSDRFGDHGLVVAATVECNGEDATIRSFIMSCRVIGRDVEHAFLAAVLGSLQSQGVRTITGIFRPSAKNAVAAKLYAECGFSGTSTTNGIEMWRMDFVSGVRLPVPATVHVQWSGNNASA